jgi:hypothetical protein
MKKIITALGLTAALLLPTTALAAEQYWTNPTEYSHALPSGFYHPIGDANKSERLPKGHTYKVSFDAAVAGSENVLLVYAQNRNYLDEFIPLTEGYQHYEFSLYAKTNTKVVFEDLQKLGDIYIKNIKVERVE